MYAVTILIPKEHTLTLIIFRMHCKLHWVEASAKCINVILESHMACMNLSSHSVLSFSTLISTLSASHTLSLVMLQSALLTAAFFDLVQCSGLELPSSHLVLLAS